MDSVARAKKLSGFLIPVFVLTGFFVWGFGAKAEWADHLVISEIQAGTVENGTEDEFVELYNPTGGAVDMTGWELRKKNSSGNEDNLVNSKKFVGVISAKHFFLIAHENYKGNTPKDLVYSANSNNLSYDNNSVILYDSSGQTIDQVAWIKLPKGQGLERKAWRNNICILAQNEGELWGNGCDTGNLDDFDVRATPNPQNSQSSAEPALENPQTPNQDPGQTPSAASPSISTSAIKNVPTAEAGADKAAVVGELVEFDGSDSFDLAGKDLTYSWTFGDGAKARGAAVSHAYQAAGQYTATLKVDNGENTAEDSSTVKISEPEFSDKVIISEILPNPTGADKDGEWIELANLSDKKINLRGWILEAKTKTGAKRYLLQVDNFIEPNAYLLVKRNQSNLVLANTGGEVSLLLPPDKNLAKVSYGEAKEGKSYALTPNTRDIWQWTDVPTPGKENIIGVADKTTKSIVEEKNSADAPSGIALPESGVVADEEISSAPNSAGKNHVQNSAVQLVAVSDLEKYLGKAIGDKISEAVSGLVIKSAEPAEKISAPENSESPLGSQSAFAADGNSVQLNKKDGAKNDPWFYSSLMLSGLSLFLVWRLWELKKLIKKS